MRKAKDEITLTCDVLVDINTTLRNICDVLQTMIMPLAPPSAANVDHTKHDEAYPSLSPGSSSSAWESGPDDTANTMPGGTLNRQ